MAMPLRASHIVSIVLGTLLLAMTGAVSAQNYQVTTLATGLDKPWSIAAINNGAFLITEKSGRLVRLDADGTITAISNTPRSTSPTRAVCSRCYPTRHSQPIERFI